MQKRKKYDFEWKVRSKFTSFNLGLWPCDFKSKKVIHPTVVSPTNKHKEGCKRLCSCNKRSYCGTTGVDVHHDSLWYEICNAFTARLTHYWSMTSLPSKISRTRCKWKYYNMWNSREKSTKFLMYVHFSLFI